MSISLDLSGKVAIVTGASKGIGKAIALGLAQNGAQVVISSRSQESLDAVLKEIKSIGGTGLSIACHVGKQDQLEQLVKSTITHFGQIDILVNNAATNPVLTKLSESSLEVFDKIMNVNVKACLSLSNLCYPHMLTQAGGSIINIASVEGFKPSLGLGMYSMSKAALIMLTKCQAKEWGRKGIRSNAICPGLIKTKLSQALWKDDQLLKGFTGQLPIDRIGLPEDMVGLALYLASDAAAYTTGAIINSDGGYLI